MNLSLKVISIKVLILMLLAVSSAKGASNPFRIVGYVPSWIDVPAFTQSFDFKQVTHINFAFQNPDSMGNLVGNNDGLEQLVSKAHASQVKVLISIGGGSAGGGKVKDYFHTLVSSSEKRADFIHKIVIYLSHYQLDGLDVDEEGAAINSNYGDFIRQLSDSLKPKGYLLTTAIGWGRENIQNSTLLLFDYITLMAYDYTGNWDLKRPGQHSPLWYGENLINDYISRGVKKENICLGLPFYGYGFYKSPGSYNYNKLLEKFPQAWQTDQVGDTIYYNGMNTIWKKTKMALEKTSGVMIWELSNDVQGERSLLKVISTTVDSAKVQVSPVLLKVK